VKGGAFTRPGAVGNITAVGGNDLSNDDQPDASSLFLAGHEGLEGIDV
jgi:hypothetical protein